MVEALQERNRTLVHHCRTLCEEAADRIADCMRSANTDMHRTLDRLYATIADLRSGTHANCVKAKEDKTLLGRVGRFKTAPKSKRKASLQLDEDESGKRKSKDKKK